MCPVSQALRGTPAIGAALLHRRALHRAVGTEDTTITRLGLQQDAAVRALIEILAGIHGHDLEVRVSAGRARQDGLENELDHTRRHFGSDLRDAQAPSFVESGSGPGTYPLRNIMCYLQV